LTDSRGSSTSLRRLRGWLFDFYPSGSGKMTVWVIAENGERVKLQDRFRPKIYVSGTISDLHVLEELLLTCESVAGWRYVEKYADFMENKRSKVLELTVTDCGHVHRLISQLLRFKECQRLSFHNVDVPIVQAYLYNRNIFPLAFAEATALNSRLSYTLLDSVEDVDYRLPPLRVMSLQAEVAAERAVHSFNDPIGSITLKWDGGSETFGQGDEDERILRMVEAVRQKDPDIILTERGDAFLFPYLAHRALVNHVLDKLLLGRDDVPLEAEKRRGKTFFSYGRVYYRASTHRLYGRIHVDEANTFIYSACGLDGLIEVSRTCRVPLHKAARASIGSIMSSLQLYQATRDNILIPWKRREREALKSARDLLVADRGGFIFEPKLGIHDDVAEVDFSSMYPTLMANKNISAETVLCKCCTKSKIRVPELEYNVCEKRDAIVPRTLRMILGKRDAYKRLRDETEDAEWRRVYDRRQNALKWILVTCFGYLGYRNARFGKVDAHIAICAFARDALLKTAHLAEEKGFEVVHGIVDSLWLKKRQASPKEYAELCEAVHKHVGVQLKVEGRYRWIVFLPSRTHPEVPVLNRYYGVFESGEIKMRGIEAVKTDTPRFISCAQQEMIKVLAEATSSTAFLEKIPESIEVLRGYAEKLKRGDLDVEDLIIAKRLSTHPDSYTHDVFQAIAAKQLVKEGMEASAGQTVRYLITDAGNKRPNKRVKAAELIDADTHFDAEEYLNMLILAATDILSPFEYTEELLKDRVVYGEKQAALKPFLKAK